MCIPRLMVYMPGVYVISEFPHHLSSLPPLSSCSEIPGCFRDTFPHLGYTHISIIFLTAFSVTKICQLKISFWKPNLVKNIPDYPRKSAWSPRLLPPLCYRLLVSITITSPTAAEGLAPSTLPGSSVQNQKGQWRKAFHLLLLSRPIKAWSDSDRQSRGKTL